MTKKMQWEIYGKKEFCFWAFGFRFLVGWEYRGKVGWYIVWIWNLHFSNAIYLIPGLFLFAFSSTDFYTLLFITKLFISHYIAQIGVTHYCLQSVVKERNNVLYGLFGAIQYIFKQCIIYTIHSNAVHLQTKSNQYSVHYSTHSNKI